MARFQTQTDRVSFIEGFINDPNNSPQKRMRAVQVLKKLDHTKVMLSGFYVK